MTLTEQWKAGGLESGYYFFKTKDNIKIGFLYEGFKYPYDGRYNTIDGVEEVLASVPTYEEQDNIIKCYLSAHERAKNLTQENEQLKEEIKMLKEVIYDLDGLECPKCGNYHRRGWTCSQCGYGK